MRVRETITGGFTTPHVTTRKQRSSCTGSFTTTTSTSYSGVKETKRIEDVNCPGFGKLKEQCKVLPMNPVVITHLIETRIPSTVGNYNSTTCLLQSTEGAYAEDLSAFFIAIPSVSQGVIDDVLTRAAAKAVAPVMDALTFVAEAKEIQKMVVGGIKALRDIWATMLANYKYARNRHLEWDTWKRLKKARRNNKRRLDNTSLEGLWLTYRYGIMPVIFAIQDAIKALEKKQQKLGDLVKGQAIFVIDVDEEDVLISTPDPVSTVRVTTRTVGTITVRSTAFGQLQHTRSAFGGSVIVTAYELVTLSFVLDWFVHVGAWLTTIAYSGDVKVVAQCASIKTDVTQTVTRSFTRAGSLGGSPPVIATGGGGPTEHSMRTVKYERWAASPPLLPSWNPRLTLPRYLDAAALLAVFTGGTRKNSKGA